jgi:hypothetical protein
VLSNVRSPNETEGRILRDIDVERLPGLAELWGSRLVIAPKQLESLDRDIAEIGRGFWECDECGRLAVSFPHRRDTNVKWYAPEDGKAGHLMKFREEGQ